MKENRGGVLLEVAKYSKEEEEVDKKRRPQSAVYKEQDDTMAYDAMADDVRDGGWVSTLN